MAFMSPCFTGSCLPLQTTTSPPAMPLPTPPALSAVNTYDLIYRLATVEAELGHVKRENATMQQAYVHLLQQLQYSHKHPALERGHGYLVQDEYSLRPRDDTTVQPSPGNATLHLRGPTLQSTPDGAHFQTHIPTVLERDSSLGLSPLASLPSHVPSLHTPPTPRTPTCPSSVNCAPQQTAAVPQKAYPSGKPTMIGLGIVPEHLVEGGSWRAARPHEDGRKRDQEEIVLSNVNSVLSQGQRVAVKAEVQKIATPSSQQPSAPPAGATWTEYARAANVLKRDIQAMTGSKPDMVVISELGAAHRKSVTCESLATADKEDLITFSEELAEPGPAAGPPTTTTQPIRHGYQHRSAAQRKPEQDVQQDRSKPTVPSSNADDMETTRALLMYRPKPEQTDIFRSVLISGIPTSASLADVLSQIRGGLLVSITPMNTKALTGSLPVLLTFLHEASARAFTAHAAQHPLHFATTPLTTGPSATPTAVPPSVTTTLLPTPTFPLPPRIHHAITTQGATRYLDIYGLYPDTSLLAIAKVLAEPGTTHHGIVESHRSDLGTVGLAFCSVAAALKACERMRFHPWFRMVRVEFGCDPCCLPLRGGGEANEGVVGSLVGSGGDGGIVRGEVLVGAGDHVAAAAAGAERDEGGDSDSASVHAVDTLTRSADGTAGPAETQTMGSKSLRAEALAFDPVFLVTSQVGEVSA